MYSSYVPFSTFFQMIEYSLAPHIRNLHRIIVHSEVIDVTQIRTYTIKTFKKVKKN